MTVDIPINLPQDRESQIKIALAFYPLWGAKTPPICKKCGGIKDPEQSKTRRCLCNEETALLKALCEHEGV